MKTHCIRLLAAAGGWLLPVLLTAQTPFSLVNSPPGPVLAPVYGTEPLNPTLRKAGNTATGIPAGSQSYSGLPLQGSAYTAQIWIGPDGASEAELAPLLPTTGFRTNAGILVPITLEFPAHYSQGSPVTLQLRVWQNRGGTIQHWGQVLADPTIPRGLSLPWDTLVPPPSNPPPAAVMAGLRSFNLFLAIPPPILLRPDWYNIVGGAGISAAGTKVLSGTIGQPVVGEAGADGLRLIAGFWAGSGRVLRPDLVAALLQAPDLVVRGRAFEVTGLITNAGPGTAPAVWRDRLYLSNDPTVDGGDRLLQQWTRTSALPRLQGYPVSAEIVLSNTVPAGHYYLLLYADALGVVSEVRENNNVLARPIVVSATDPLVIGMPGKVGLEPPRGFFPPPLPPEVRRVEYFMNGKFVGTAYKAPFNLDLNPALVGADNFVALGPNRVVGAAYDENDQLVTTGESLFDAWTQGLETSVEILEPDRSLEIFSPSVGPVRIWLRARVTKKLLRFSPWGDPMGLYDVLVGASVYFRVDGDLVHTSTQGTGEDGFIHECEFTAPGLALGPHRVFVSVDAGEDYRRSADSVTFNVRQIPIGILTPRFETTRTINRHGNWFDVNLSVNNVGDAAATLRQLEECVTGFQVCSLSSSRAVTSLAPVFSYEDQQNRIQATFPAGSVLNPGQSYTLSYRAVPVLFRTEGVDYAFGGGSLDYAFVSGPFSTYVLPRSGTVGTGARAQDVGDAATTALRGSDYLLVTSPINLETLYTASGAMQVMTNMAELAIARNGVLGYYHGVGRIRTAFVHGDLVAVGRTFRPGIGRDQVFIGRMAENEIRSYYESEEVRIPDELPIQLNYDLQAGDALAVGNICAGTECGEDRAEIVIAKGNGDGYLVYKYNPETRQFSSSEFVPFIKFGRGDHFVLGEVFPEVSGIPLDEFIVANSEGVRVWNYGSTTPSATIGVSLGSKDLFAVGRVFGGPRDDFVVGDVAGNQLRVYQQNTGGLLAYPLRATLSITLDEDDQMAVGDVMGDTRAEIIVADNSDDRIKVFANTEGYNFEEVADFPFKFVGQSSFVFLDRLAVGYFGSREKERILVISGHPEWGLFEGNIDIIALSGGETPGDRNDLDSLLNVGGAWASRLSPNWTSEGFLLLVGEHDVIPAFGDAWHLKWNDDTGKVDFTDREYATTRWPTDSPELSIGRLIGNSAERLSRSLGTAVEMASNSSLLRNLDAYCVSGYENGPPPSHSDSIEFAPLRDSIADTLRNKGFSVREEHTPNVPSEATVMNFAQGQDVIFLAGHGNWGGWDIIDSDEVEDLFDPGTTRPFVFAASCLTGRYAGGNSLPEAFMWAGASSYVGATEVQVGLNHNCRGWFKRFAEAFFTHLAPDRPLGTTMKQAKLWRLSQRANTYSWDWNYNYYHCAVNHFFGDPKLEIAWTGGLAPAPLANGSASPASTLMLTGPVSQAQVTVPMYTVTTMNGEDWADIAGQEEHVMVIGRPIVPLNITLVEFPKGYKVQSVTLQQRSEPLIGPGLHLPIAESLLPGNTQTKSSLIVPPGWWPDLDFYWSATENDDGSSTLAIRAYAFQTYFDGSNQTQVRFYTNYTFGVDYALSEVEIRQLATDRLVYPTGAVVRADLCLCNTGQTPLDVNLTAQVISEVAQVTNQVTVDPMTHLQGWGWTQVQWDSAGQPSGPYRLEVVARNAQGTLLDEAATEFQIGQSLGTISAFNMSPRDYLLGDNVNLSATFANTGSRSIEGTVIIAIQDAAGNPVTEFRRDFTSLMPGSTFSFSTVWSNANLTPRNCQVIVYAQYGGQTTALMVGADWHDAPLRWDSVVLANGQVQLRWASVAGRRYSIEFTPDLSTPFTSLVTGLLAAPPHNTVTLAVPPDSSGFFRLREE